MEKEVLELTNELYEQLSYIHNNDVVLSDYDFENRDTRYNFMESMGLVECKKVNEKGLIPSYKISLTKLGYDSLLDKEKEILKSEREKEIQDKRFLEMKREILEDQIEKIKTLNLDDETKTKLELLFWNVQNIPREKDAKKHAKKSIKKLQKPLGKAIANVVSNIIVQLIIESHKR